MSLNKNKEKCKELRKIRTKLAKELGIKGIEDKECLYKGDCQGTCVKCEYEEKMLLNSIYELKKQKKLKIDLIEDDIKNRNLLGFMEKRERPIKKELVMHLEGDVIYNEDEKDKNSKYEDFLSKTNFSKNNKKE